MHESYSATTYENDVSLIYVCKLRYSVQRFLLVHIPNFFFSVDDSFYPGKCSSTHHSSSSWVGTYSCDRIRLGDDGSKFINKSVEASILSFLCITLCRKEALPLMFF